MGFWSDLINYKGLADPNRALPKFDANYRGMFLPPDKPPVAPTATPSYVVDPKDRLISQPSIKPTLKPSDLSQLSDGSVPRPTARGVATSTPSSAPRRAAAGSVPTLSSIPTYDVTKFDLGAALANQTPSTPVPASAPSPVVLTTPAGPVTTQATFMGGNGREDAAGVREVQGVGFQTGRLGFQPGEEVMALDGSTPRFFGPQQTVSYDPATGTTTTSALPGTIGQSLSPRAVTAAAAQEAGKARFFKEQMDRTKTEAEAAKDTATGVYYTAKGEAVPEETAIARLVASSDAGYKSGMLGVERGKLGLEKEKVGLGVGKGMKGGKTADERGTERWQKQYKANLDGISKDITSMSLPFEQKVARAQSLTDQQLGVGTLPAAGKTIAPAGTKVPKKGGGFYTSDGKGGWR